MFEHRYAEMTQSQRSKLVDPFQGQSILSLNPRTFGHSKDALKCKDLEAIHQHMNSMALQFPDKHFEKARSIVDGLEFINTNESEADTNNKENPQANRPALARKRAKFSLKLDTSIVDSQPSTVVEPSFQFDQLQDPEEFFAAFEKFENARKEMKRQRGDEDLNDAKISSTARHRRPEIPRRKTSYKHHEYSSQSKNDTSFAQETLQDNNGSPPAFCSQQESVTPIWESNEDEVSRSITKKENRLNKLVDDLMDSNIDEINGKEALSFLKDHLKIKPVDISDLRLPDIHRLDFLSPLKNLIKDQRMLSGTRALPDGLTLGKQKKLSDNPFHPLDSPTPPRSPFLAISKFGKRILKSIESNDPFSAHDIDLFPTTASTESNKEFPISGTLDSLAKNKVIETAIDVTQKVSAGASINMEERDVNDNEVGPCVVTDIQTNEGIKGNVEDVVQKAASVTQLDINFEEITDNVHLQCLQDREENVGVMTEKAGSSTLPEVNVEVSTIEDLEGHRSPSAKTGANSTEGLDASGPADIVPEQQNKEHPKTSTNKRKNTTKRRQVDQRKRRQSLAEAGTSWESGVRKSNRVRRRPLEYWKGERLLYGRVHNKAGTSWESGVRRSNRVRRRPLEYWKGERLLYGRVHNSLPTVIGVKYISPTKDNGKPGFKVESFVSDQYKDLVELIALH